MLGGEPVRTKEIATRSNVHPNTVRLYEEFGYISPAPRDANGYRNYTVVHDLQMQIARHAFRQEFIQNNLRTKAKKIVKMAGAEQFSAALTEAKGYLLFLKKEHDFALKAISTVEIILKKEPLSETTYTHQEIAQQLQLTEETLRNWERNGLYQIKRNMQNRRMYNDHDYQKLLIIRTLRSAHFSIAAIRHLFEKINPSFTANDIQQVLNSPKFIEDFLHVTDELEVNIKKAMIDVESIIAFLKQLIAMDLET